MGESRRSEGLGEWNGQTFYAFCLIKIATARGAAAAAGTADSGPRTAAAAAGAGAVAFAGTAFFQIKLALHLIKAATFVQLEAKAETELATTTSVMQLSDYLINNKAGQGCTPPDNGDITTAGIAAKEFPSY